MSGTPIENELRDLLESENLAKSKSESFDNAERVIFSSSNFAFSGAGIDVETITQTLKGRAKFDGKNVKIKAINVLESVKKELKQYSFLDKLGIDYSIY